MRTSMHGFLYLSILLSWHNINFTLPYDLVPPLPTSILLQIPIWDSTIYQFWTLFCLELNFVRRSCSHCSLLIVFASLKLFLYPLLSLLLGPLLLPLKLPWLTVTLAAYIASHNMSLLIPSLISIGSFLPHSLSYGGFSLDLTPVKSWLRQIEGNIGIYRQIDLSKLEQITNTKNTMGNVKSYIFL